VGSSVHVRVISIFKKKKKADGQELTMKVFKFVVLGAALVVSSAAFADLKPEGQTPAQIASFAVPEGEATAQVAAYPGPEGQTQAQIASYRVREEK
jgi:hypothetical protein